MREAPTQASWKSKSKGDNKCIPIFIPKVTKVTGGMWSNPTLAISIKSNSYKRNKFYNNWKLFVKTNTNNYNNN